MAEVLFGDYVIGKYQGDGLTFDGESTFQAYAPVGDFWSDQGKRTLFDFLKGTGFADEAAKTFLATRPGSTLSAGVTYDSSATYTPISSTGAVVEWLTNVVKFVPFVGEAAGVFTSAAPAPAAGPLDNLTPALPDFPLATDVGPLDALTPALPDFPIDPQLEQLGPLDNLTPALPDYPLQEAAGPLDNLTPALPDYPLADPAPSSSSVPDFPPPPAPSVPAPIGAAPALKAIAGLASAAAAVAKGAAALSAGSSLANGAATARAPIVSTALPIAGAGLVDPAAIAAAAGTPAGAGASTVRAFAIAGVVLVAVYFITRKK